MRAAILLICSLAALNAVPVCAQSDRPVTDRSVSIGDAVATPASDLNLKKGEIPALLIAAQERPYDLAGLARCNQIARAIGDLDVLLGDDLDLPQGEDGGLSAGRVAQAAVGSFIPFRGLIREISGANSQDRKVQAAIAAGTARRSFLKGYGQAHGCRYPARAVTPAALTARQRQTAAAETSKSDQDQTKGQKFVARPVVQKTD